MKTTVLLVAGIAAAATADVQPFTETFEDAAGWIAGDFGPLNEVASGAADGSSYVSTDRSFENTDPGSFDVLFRGEPSTLPGIVPEPSGGAFQGDYIASGIDTLRFDFRHNGVAPVTAFVRFSPPARFPGAIAVEFAPVLPNQWQTIELDISALSPNFVSFSGASYQAIFNDIGLVQIGVDSTNLAGLPGTFTFDLDNVEIVPAPSAAGVLGLGLLAAARRRR